MKITPSSSVHRFFGTLLVMILILLTGAPAMAAEKIISPGDFFPAYRIRTDLSTADAAYLGLPEEAATKGYFVLKDTWGDVIVLELFNRYCFGCQQEAPILNRVYEAVASDPALSRTVRFMGIGVGNLDKAVEEFRSEFNVEFPLISDPHFSILDAVGNPGGTPFIMILRRTSSGFILIRTHFGVVESADTLVDEIRNIAAGDAHELLTDVEQVTLPPWIKKKRRPPLTEDQIEDRVLKSMDRAGYGSVGLYSVDLPDGEKVYIGESGRGKVFSMVVSRLPVCNVSRPINFILTINTSGKIVDFDALTLTKYWNRPWTEQEVQEMRRKLLGLSVFEVRVFDPSVDAVTSATMSSSLIFDSIHRIAPVMELLKRGGHI